MNEKKNNTEHLTAEVGRLIAEGFQLPEPCPQLIAAHHGDPAPGLPESAELLQRVARIVAWLPHDIRGWSSDDQASFQERLDAHFPGRWAGPEAFMDEVGKRGIQVPIMVGIVLLKSAGMARYMNNFVPGVVVPAALIEELGGIADADLKQKSVEIAARLIRDMKGMCQGAHIMPLGWDDCVAPVVEQTGLN